MNVTCGAYAGVEGRECTNTAVGRDTTGTPLCSAHLAQTDVAEPNTVDVETVETVLRSEVMT